MNMYIENIIEENSLEYANYVIKNRAIPDLRDGMKPVHRRIIYAMHDMKAYNFTKSMNITGHVSKFHPHGDSYGTIVTMVQKDGNLTTYIDGKGNFASHTSRDLAPGASRYTEAKLSEMAKDIFKELDKKTVDFIDNYDGSRKMPEVLPVKYPAILHYCQEGIAYSMSSRIPSFNLVELNNAVIRYINDGTMVNLVPDFATGGYIIDQEHIFERINREGTGTVRLRAKATIDKNVISITEIPFSTTREAIVDKIIDLVKSGKLKEIQDVKDLTGLYGMEIEVTCKKNTDMNLMLEKLYQLTPMESTYSCNMNVIVDGLPKVMGVWQIIDKWIAWRKGCIRRGISNEIDSLSKKLHLLKGLERVLLNIDKTIEIIRFSPEIQINSKLMQKFSIDEVQADYISNMKLRNINKDYIIKQIKDIKNLEQEVIELKVTLADDQRINKIVCDGLEEVSKKYGKDRMTELTKVNEVVRETIVQVRNEVEDYNVRLIVTKDGYVKKLSMAMRAEQVLKPGDEIVMEFETNNRNELVVFSGTDAHKVRISQLNDCRPNQLGDYLPTILKVDHILGYTVIDDRYKYVMILYSNGKIAKISIDSYKTETNRKKLSNSLCKDLNVVKIMTLEDDTDIIVVNSKGKKVEKSTTMLPAKKSRGSQGSTLARDIVDVLIK